MLTNTYRPPMMGCVTKPTVSLIPVVDFRASCNFIECRSKYGYFLFSF